MFVAKNTSSLHATTYRFTIYKSELKYVLPPYILVCTYISKHNIKEKTY